MLSHSCLTPENALEYLLIRLWKLVTCDLISMASRKGRKNRRTLYREHLEKVAQREGKFAVVNGSDHIGDSLAVMGEALHFFAQMARDEKKNLVKKGEYYLAAVSVANKLAPFRYPTYATVKVGGVRENPPPVREGVTSQEIMAELMELIAETGLLPSPLSGDGIINVTPERVENRSG
jgi:hypothetical protein